VNKVALKGLPEQKARSKGRRDVRIFAPLSDLKKPSRAEPENGEDCMGARSQDIKTAVFMAASVLTLLATPAYSQTPKQSNADSKAVVDPDSLPQAKELDRRYRDVLKRQPDGVAAQDPWASVRASEVPSKPKDKKNSATTGTTATK
jgi:hypothetical protein